MRTRIKNIVMTPGVTTEAHIPFIDDAEILIDGQRIVYAGKKTEAPAFEAQQEIDGGGALAMPGLTNCHTHTPMTLLRSVGSDLTLEDWLHNAIFPLEKHLTDDTVKAGTDLGVMEMLRFGTTSFNDMYMHMDSEAVSVQETGMRALLGYGIVDFDESCSDFPPALELMEKWNHKANDRIRVSLAPHSETCTTKKLLDRVLDASLRYDLPIHIHISETQCDRDDSLKRQGLTPPKYLESIGMLERPVIAAHCVWLTDEEIALFAQKGVVIVHNPISNLKLASGVAPIAKMLKAGCKIALGTDGVASNNNLNLWEEMKLMPLLQKGTMLDPTVVSPAQTVAAATSTGAMALGYRDLGLLKAGNLADIILVDMDRCCPGNDRESDLVYTVQGTDVTMTMVDGKVLYHNGIYTTLQPELVKSRAKKEAEALFKRAEKAKSGANK
ncbi:MAG: amidohydrolase [Eubacteriales bacterium]|nr:amidohydrolase [Eubacteriales bacterium]